MADLYYYEQGYIDDGYHVYIANAVIEISPYIEDGYIEAGYYDDYSVRSTLSCTAQIVVGQEVVANGALFANSTFAVTATKTVSATSNLNTTFTQTAFGQRDRDIDLFAFSDAQLSVTVALIRDHNIQLSTVFSTAIDVARLRNITAEETSLFDISADLRRSRAFQSETQAAFSISVTADNLVKQASANLNTAFTQQSAGGFTFEYSAALISRARVFTSKYFGTGRPRNLVIGEATFNTTNKFGTHSLTTSGINTNTYVDFVPAKEKDFVLDFWYNRTSASGSLLCQFSTGGLNSFIRVNVTSTGTIGYNLYGTEAFNYTDTTGYSTNTWYHIAIVKNSGRLSIYHQGQRKYTTTSIGQYEYTGFKQLTFLAFVSNGGFRLDEFSLIQNTTLGYNPSSTTITVPTSARINDPSNTIALYHFDNNLIDDTSSLLTDSAALQSTANITARLSGPVKYSAALTSSATLAAQVNKSTDIDLVAFTSGQLTADVENVRGFDSALSVISNINIDADKVTDTNADLSANLEIVIDNARLRDNSISTEAIATQLSAVVRLAGLIVDDITVFQMSTDAVVTRSAVSQQQSQFTSINDLARIRFADSGLDSAFTQSTEAFVGVVGTSHLTTAVTLSVSSNRIRDNISTQQSAFTVYAFANNLGKIEATVFADVNLTVDAVKTTEASVDLESAVTLSADTLNSVTHDSIIDLDSAFTQDTDAEKRVGTFVNLTAFAVTLTVAVKDVVALVEVQVNSSLSVQTEITASAQAQLQSTASIDVSAVKTVIVDSTQLGEFTQTADAITVLQAHADLEAFAFELAAAAKIADFFINCESSFVQSITATVLRNVSADLTSNTILTAPGERILEVDSSNQIQFTLDSTAQKIAQAEIVIQSALAFIAGVRELRLDDIVYVIPGEIWTYEISSETRRYQIGSETRTYIIQGD